MPVSARDVENLAVRVDAEIIRRQGLFEFGRRAWHIVEPGVPFLENWHQRVICRLAEACVAGEDWAVRQVINIPPGTGKSLWLCTFLPAWVWTVWPGFRSIYASYDIGVSLRDARRTLQIIQSDWFQARWPDVRIRGSNPAEGMFENSAGGFRFSTSVESKATGRHGHLRVVDDPIKPLETTGAREAGGAKLDAVIDWWSNTMSTRVTDPSCPRYMVIMQRLHERDLAGWLTAKDRPASERPLHVVFPMRFDPRRRFVAPDDELVDPRRTAGELFWPGRFPEPAVKSLELALGTHASAQLDQDPVPPKGHLFSSDEQRYYEDEPEVLARRADRVILSADCTFKESTGSDYVAIQVWAELREDRYVRGLGTIGVWYALLDEVWRRMGFVDTLAEVERLVRKWPGIGAKLVEDKANGSAVIDVLRRKIPGLIEVQPNGGKVARANAVQYLYRAGNVFYPTSEHAPWIVDHTAELIKFPRGRNDDRVDAETQALSYLAGQPMGILDAMGLLA